MGGNLRLRTPNRIKSKSRRKLKKASGENKNYFFSVNQIKDPIMFKSANLKPLKIQETYLYDMPTKQGEVCSFVLE